MPRAKRLKFGNVWIDSVTLPEALDRVQHLVESGQGGCVFTPNVDHIVLASEDPRLAAAYQEVSLSLVDGMPVFWMSKLMGQPFPVKISGSDFLFPVAELAAKRGYRVVLFGGSDGAAERATHNLREQLPNINIVGHFAPRVNINDPPEARAKVLDPIRELKPDIVFVGLGCPKQELWIQQVREALRPAVLLAIGASIDFTAGMLERSPEWISKFGFEWLYRLSKEPDRLWRRYLLRDPKVLPIFARALWAYRLGNAAERNSDDPLSD